MKTCCYCQTEPSLISVVDVHDVDCGFFSLCGEMLFVSLFIFYFLLLAVKRLARPEATSSSSCAEFRETLLFSLVLFFGLCVITQNGSKQF